MILRLLRLVILGTLLLMPLACQNASNPITGGYPSEAEVEARSFQLINQSRASNGLPSLAFDSQLSDIARAHSQDMRDRSYFAHNDPDGNSPSSRMRTGGFTFKISGENIARTTGMKDPGQVANDEFLNDQAHREVLLNQEFTKVGIGVARSGTDYWITQDYIGQ
jgi:uncharacterized protein YkwD